MWGSRARAFTAEHCDSTNVTMPVLPSVTSDTDPRPATLPTQLENGHVKEGTGGAFQFCAVVRSSLRNRSVTGRLEALHLALSSPIKKRQRGIVTLTE